MKELLIACLLLLTGCKWMSSRSSSLLRDDTGGPQCPDLVAELDRFDATKTGQTASAASPNGGLPSAAVSAAPPSATPSRTPGDPAVNNGNNQNPLSLPPDGSASSANSVNLPDTSTDQSATSGNGAALLTDGAANPPTPPPNGMASPQGLTDAEGENLDKLYVNCRVAGGIDAAKNSELIIRVGAAYGYGAYLPDATVESGNRYYFEEIRDLSAPAEQDLLSSGLRRELDAAIAKRLEATVQGGLDRLMTGFPVWTDLKLDTSPDFLFKDFGASFKLANDYLRVLFILRTNRSNGAIAKAKGIASQFVQSWLSGLGDKASSAPPAVDDGMKYLMSQLGDLGSPEVVARLEAFANQEPNRPSGPTIATATSIYTQQFRNAVLKELMQITSDARLKGMLDTNEKALTTLLDNYKTSEGETNTLPDQNSALNMFALAATVISAADPGAGLDAINRSVKLGLPRYYVESDNPASLRATSSRWVVVTLARLAHAKPEEKFAIKLDLDKAVADYEKYLPDLMLHVRGRGMHRGNDMLAPYFFHPSVPYLALALNVLMQDSSFAEEFPKYRQIRDYVVNALLATQKRDGTFISPDISTGTDVGYYGSAAWVNPLTGIALLSLMEMPENR